MRLYSWLELFKARLRFRSHFGRRQRSRTVTTRRTRLQFEKLEDRMLMAAPQPFDLGTLDGITGFTFEGEALDDYAGFSVRSAGDINVDGFDDLIITAPLSDLGANAGGSTYVVLGGPSLDAFDAADVNGADGLIDLAEIAGFGFRFDGLQADNYPDTPNFSVFDKFHNAPLNTAAGIGDMNGDGVADIAISQPARAAVGNQVNRGQIYVVWGGTTAITNAITGGTINLASLDNTDTTDTFGATGIRIHGSQSFSAGPPLVSGSYAGYSLSGAGDVDGDGYDDLLIGAHRFDANTGNASLFDHGEAYIVFGKSVGVNNSSGWFDDSAVTLGAGGTHTFSISNSAAQFAGEDEHSLGFAVTGVGDINGDGRSDFAVAATFGHSSINDAGTGRVYVIFGGERGSLAGTTASLDGSNGFRIDGAFAADYAGWAVSSAGDMNGDGFDDLVIGAPYHDPSAKLDAGAAYVIFGRANFASTPLFRLRTDIDGATGFRIEGQYAGDLAGASVGGGGDIDGDGFDDIIIGARGYNNNTGRVYVVFGRKTGFDQFMLLKDVVGTDPTIPVPLATGHLGFSFDGIGSDYQAGWSVANAGDINGDGFADILIGSPFAYSGPALDYAGQAYVIFGGNFRNRPGTQVGGSGDDTLDGGTTPAAPRDYLIGGIGDDHLHSDGGPDVLIGGQGNDFIYIPDANFFIPTGILTGDPQSTRRIQGGHGEDTLVFNSNTTTGDTLDLTLIPDNRIQGIEVIDIRNGSNTLSLNGNEVRRISNAGFTNPNNTFGAPNGQPVLGPTGNYLMVRRSIGDVVLTSGLELANGVDGWQKLYDVHDSDPTSSTYGVTFEVYVQGNQLGQAILLVEDPAVLNLTQVDGYDPTDGGTSGVQPNGHQGVTFFGQTFTDYTGFAVSGVGDVDGDGFDDFLIGAFGSAGVNGTKSGATFLVFGKGATWNPTFDLEMGGLGGLIDGTNGIRLAGIDPDDESGISVSGLGDVDGDGYADFIIGANRADVSATLNTSEGEAYLLFGKTFENRGAGNAFWTGGNTFILGSDTEGGDIDGTNGFVLRGNNPNDFAGFSVSGGDINGDGLSDLLISAFQADDDGNYDTVEGKTYVVFGGVPSLTALDGADTATDGIIALNNVDGQTGFRLDGVSVNDRTGRNLSIAGDFNGDGFADFLIGGHGVDADPDTSTLTNEGAVYLIFGKQDWSDTPVVNLNSIDGTNGLRFNGAAAGDFTGWNSSYAGDVDGDGFDDIIIGAYRANGNGGESGRAYVIFGQSNWASFGTAGFDLSTVDGSNGFIVNGFRGFDNAGFAVTGVGDFNGDGFDDIVVGAPRDAAHSDLSRVRWSFNAGVQPTGGYSDTGQLYLVFGKADWSATPVFQPDEIDGLNGIRIDGITFGDYAGAAVRAGGDINGDGFGDILIGAPRAYGETGQAYVVFGGSFLGLPPVTSVPPRPDIGTDGADTLSAVGGTDVDKLIGRQGDDVLNSDGGDDILRAGEGDDNIVLADVAFTGPRRIDGGNGNAAGVGVDTLTFGTGVTGAHLNLTQLGDNRIQNIEVIDITGSGTPVTDPSQVDNTLTLDVLEVLNISTGARGRELGTFSNEVSLSNTLTVLRNFGDVVNIGAGWTPDAVATFDPVYGQFFNGYTAIANAFTGGEARLFIENVNVVIDGSAATVNGTNGDDVIIYDAQTHVLTFNGVDYDLDEPLLNALTEVTSVVVLGFGGNDRVELRGTVGDDIALVGNTTVSATFTGPPDAPGTSIRTLSGTSVEFSTLDGRGQTVQDSLILTGSGQVVNLTSPFGNLNKGLEIIDLTGSGNTTMFFDHPSIVANDAAGDTLTVLRNFGDQVFIVDDASFWTHDPNAEWDPVRQVYFEHVTEAPELVRIQSPLVTIAGANANVIGSNGNDLISYYVATNVVNVNGLNFDLNLPGTVDFISVDGLAGRDTLTLNGTAGVEFASLSVGEARYEFDGGHSGFELIGASVEDVVVQGNGGADTAVLIGSTGNDALVATPDVATLTGAGYSQKVHDQSIVTVVANGGTDSATMLDSAGADTFVGTPTSSSMTGVGYSNRANGFDSVIGVANGGGTDTALLTGSSSNDVYVGKQTFSTLDGPGYHVQSNSFETTTANLMTGANDIARLFDTSLADSFVALPTVAYMKRGPVQYVKARNFDRAIGNATLGGFDRAILFGSNGNDSFTGQENVSTMTGPGGYLLVGNHFEQAIGRGQLGNDTANLFDNDADNLFIARQPFSQMTGGGLNLIAETFDKVVAHGADGRDRAIYYDTSGADTFTVRLNFSSLTGPGMNNQAIDFDQAIARATAGGVDRAFFEDTTGDDQFSATSAVASLNGFGVFGQANNFEQTTATGLNGGNDTASLVDSAGDDLFFGRGTEGRLSGVGFSNTVNGFDSVTAFGTSGGVNTLDIADLAYLFTQVGSWV